MEGARLGESAAGVSPQTRKEGHQGVEYPGGGFGFQVTGPRPPGFVAAELVLLRRGQVAVATIGQFNGEGLLERAALLDGQPDDYAQAHLLAPGRAPEHHLVLEEPD